MSKDEFLTMRLDKDERDFLNKLAEEWSMSRSEIVRDLRPDDDFILMLIEGVDDVGHPKKLIGELLARGMRAEMAEHPYWPLCAADLNVPDGRELYELYLAFCRGVSCLYADEGYSFEKVSEGGKEKWHLKRPAPANPKQTASVLTRDEEEVFRKMLKISGLDKKAIDKRVEKYQEQCEKENEKQK